MSAATVVCSRRDGAWLAETLSSVTFHLTARADVETVEITDLGDFHRVR